MKKIFHEFVTILFVTMGVLLINNAGIKPLEADLPQEIKEEIAYQRSDEFKKKQDDTSKTSKVFRDPIMVKKLYIGSGDHKVDINSASLLELIKLKGIGKSTAKKIIVYRNTYGAFDSIDELTNIKGIGKKKLDKIKNDN